MKAYTFNDWLVMKPGTLIGGLCPARMAMASDGVWKRPHAYVLADCWFPAEHWIAWQATFTMTVYQESVVRWRELLPATKPVTNSDVIVYTTKDMDTASWLYHRTYKTDFRPPFKPIEVKVNNIVGMYLGNILRDATNGVFWVNMLSPSGEDVWY